MDQKWCPLKLRGLHGLQQSCGEDVVAGRLHYDCHHASNSALSGTATLATADRAPAVATNDLSSSR